jgi:hypothetical protein
MAEWAQFEGKLPWQELFQRVAQIYRDAYLQDAKWMRSRSDTFLINIDAELATNLLSACLLPMENTLSEIDNHFPKQAEQARKILTACVQDVASEMKMPWTKPWVDLDKFFDDRRSELTSWAYLGNQNTVRARLTLNAIARVEKCWIDRYLGYPHGELLGRNDALMLRKWVLARVMRVAEWIAKRYDPRPPPPPPPPPPAAAAAVAVAATASDEKTLVPTTARVGVSIFGRPVVPIGFPTNNSATSNKTAGMCARRGTWENRSGRIWR